MKVSDAFPTKYVKASDLNGRAPTVTIGQVVMENIGTDRKIVLYFYGKEKGLVCNKTVCTTISKAFGDDTDNWINRQIVLFETMVDFKGESVPAIRVKPVVQAPPVQPAPQQAPPLAPAASAAPLPQHPHQQVARPHMSEMAGAGHADMNDEIPF